MDAAEAGGGMAHSESARSLAVESQRRRGGLQAWGGAGVGGGWRAQRGRRDLRPFGVLVFADGSGRQAHVAAAPLGVAPRRAVVGVAAPQLRRQALRRVHALQHEHAGGEALAIIIIIITTTIIAIIMVLLHLLICIY